MERPVKRRRISPPDEGGSELETASEGSRTPSIESVENNSKEEALPEFDANNTSRIKAKAKTNSNSNSNSTKKSPHTAPSPDQTPSNTSPPRSTTSIPTTFASLPLTPWLLTTLSNLSLHTPTAIQKACIPPLLTAQNQNQNILATSPPGTGKTLAFALPLLHLWSQHPSGVFAVILTPTRELALQIHEQILALGGGQGVRCALVTGGADMRAQAIEMGARPHVVVATPGRLAELVESGGEEVVSGLRRVRVCVLDEADRLLKEGPGGMVRDLGVCLGVMPGRRERGMWVFCATGSEVVRSLVDVRGGEKDDGGGGGGPPLLVVDLSATNNPTTAATPTPGPLAPKITQSYLLVPPHHKPKYLHILLLTPLNANTPTMIFTNRTSTATLLEHTLHLLSHSTTALHSGLAHAERQENLARFRAARARILIATDLAARGLDIPRVGLVINYDIPRDPDDYVHRIGRAGRTQQHHDTSQHRGGVGARSVSFVAQGDVERVKGIEARTGVEMAEYAEEGVSVEGRVVREALGVVGEKVREAVVGIEEGRDVRGRRRRGWVAGRNGKKGK